MLPSKAMRHPKLIGWVPQILGIQAIAGIISFVAMSSNAAEVIDRTIPPNWAAAKEDMARQPSILIALAPTALSTIHNSPVPVLLPPAFITAFSSTEASGGSRIAALEDGYTATFRGAKYDIVVSATDQIVDNGKAVPEQVEPVLSTEDGGGVSVSFRRYATSYRVEFFCSVPLRDSELCVSPDEASKIAASMKIVGGKEL